MVITVISIIIWIVTLATAAISDLRTFRISNIFPTIVIVLFLVLHAISGFSLVMLPNAWHFLMALAIGMLLFGMGWIGGGDAKLYAAVALWFDWNGAIALVLFTTLSGLLLAIVFVVARLSGIRRQQQGNDKPKSRIERRIPYGVAIAIGAILTASFVGWSAIFPAVR